MMPCVVTVGILDEQRIESGEERCPVDRIGSGPAEQLVFGNEPEIGSTIQ